MGKSVNYLITHYQLQLPIPPLFILKMKLICSKIDLSHNLSLVSRAVPSRPTHPVLASILLQADAQTNQVSLTAFDLHFRYPYQFQR